MKTNKIIKWLYGVFMFLPMLAIGVTCAYVTFNKNAKDSYSDKYIKSQLQLSLPNTLNDGFEYLVKYDEVVGNSSIKIQYSDISIDWTDYGASNSYNYNRFYLDRTSNGNTNIYLYIDNSAPVQTLWNVWGYTLFEFSFTKLETQNSLAQGPFKIYNEVINKVSLDNAFYYAVDQFNESGFNKIDFVSFFDMFYNNTNIWTTFANTYMNYVLFVSLAFFIPRVLYWFINIAFSLTDGFERKSQRW